MSRNNRAWSTGDLLRSVKHMGIASAKQAILELSDAGLVHLSRHSHPYSLNRVDRALLIRDGNNYYCLVQLPQA